MSAFTPHPDIQTARKIGEVEVIDPRTGYPIRLVVFHDGDEGSGTAFAIEASFLESGGNYDTIDPSDDDSDPVIPSPFSSAGNLKWGARMRLIGWNE